MIRASMYRAVVAMAKPARRTGQYNRILVHERQRDELGSSSAWS